MSWTIAELLERNKSLELAPMPSMSDMVRNGRPVIKTFIITCMDPRCNPELFFNAAPGELGMHRNAGGNVRYALRDVLILDNMFQLESVAIIHHTDCGTTHFTNEGVSEMIKGRVSKEHWGCVDEIDFGANADITESVRDDLKWVNGHPLIRPELKKAFQGFVFDIKTGRVEKVNVEAEK